MLPANRTGKKAAASEAADCKDSDYIDGFTKVKSVIAVEHDDGVGRGYSIRDDRYRYTRWIDFKTGKILAEEL